VTAAERAELARALGGAIRGRRLAAGVTREQLAERLGLDPTTVARWEDGNRLPTLARLRSIAAALGCTALDLVADAQQPAVSRAEFEVALAELLEAAAALVNGLVWSPSALPMAERLSAALTWVEALALARSE
jgi:transcriptional regulator with XRE-family HTH domain